MKNRFEFVIFKEPMTILTGILVLAGLHLTSLHSFLLFHTLGELFSIAVSFGIFMIAWNVRRFVENGFVLFLSMAFVFIGGLDLLHTLAYKGMGLFQGYGENLPTQLWIIGRFTQSLSFLTAFLFLNRKINTQYVLAGYSAWTGFLLMSIFRWDIFPTCFIEGTGLTLFKKISEYVICLLLVAAIALLRRKREKIDQMVFGFFLAALFFTICSELAFTFYVSVYGLSNLVGHYFKIIAFYCIYRALIETGLRQPYGVLFRELKQKEETLRESKQIQQSLLNAIPEAAFLIDPKGTVLATNHATVSRLKKTFEAVIGADIYTLLPPDIAKSRRKYVEEAIATGSPIRFEDSRNGMVIDNRVVPITDTAGKVVKVAIMGIDITERKRTEEALKKSEAWLQFLVSFNPAALYTCKPSGDFGATFVSKNISEITGHESEEFLSFSEFWMKNIHPDDLPKVLDGIPALFNKGRHSHEYRFLHKNGAWLWIFDQLRLVRDSSGNPSEIVGSLTDITQRKRAEEALESNQRMLQLIIDHSPALISYVDAEDLRYTFMNIHYELLFGKSRELMVGKTMGEVLGNEYYKKNKQNIQLAKTGVIAGFESSIRTYDGIRWLNVSYVPNMDARQNVIGFVILAFDITNRKKEEDELRKAKELAESATRAKSEFLANMSHEIRTPMNPIINMTRLLMKTNLNPKQREYAEITLAASEILLSLINDILDFSKIESGKLELEHRDFNLIQMVGDVAKILTMKAEEKGLRLTYAVDPDMCSQVRGDRVRVRQILLNFVNNAVKFTEQGWVKIRVFSENQTETHTTVRIAVSDTGVGIPQDRADRLFKSFSQADTSITRKYGGTGLGLAISKHLAKLMGGQVGFESQEGKGSTFWFAVPFEKAEAGEDDRSEKLRRTENTKHPLASVPPFSPRILLAEDNIFNQKVTLAILANFGLATDVACNGKEAVGMLRNADYDLVLMDLHMPEMDGLEATRLIRNPDSGVQDHDVQIVAMTANAAMEDRDKCLAAGMNGYLTKPVNANELLALIKNLAVIRRPEMMGKKAEGHDPSLPLTDSPSPTAQIFDRDDLLNRLGGDEKLFDIVLKAFHEKFAEEIEKLKIALDEKDAEKIRYQAHKMIGMCANASAYRLREVVCQIELAGKQRDPDTAITLHDRLEAEFVKAQSEMAAVDS